MQENKNISQDNKQFVMQVIVEKLHFHMEKYYPTMRYSNEVILMTDQ